MRAKVNGASIEIFNDSDDKFVIRYPIPKKYAVEMISTNISRKVKILKGLSEEIDHLYSQRAAIEKLED